MSPLGKTFAVEIGAARRDFPHEPPIVSTWLCLAAQAMRAPAAILKLHRSLEIGSATEVAPDKFAVVAPFIEQTLADGNVLVVSDIHPHSIWNSGAAPEPQPAIRFYAGVCIKLADGQPGGVLAVLDYVPRALADNERASLQILAYQIAQQLASYCLPQPTAAREMLADQPGSRLAHQTPQWKRMQAARVTTAETVQVLARTNRILRFVTRSGDALVKCDDDVVLLQKICDLAVDIGGYTFACVEQVPHRPNAPAAPRAYAGPQDASGFAFALQTGLPADATKETGPDGTGVRSGLLPMVAGLAHDPACVSWREPVGAHGCRGMIALPLRANGNTFGTLVLYSTDVIHASQDELGALQDLADNVAFRLNDIRASNDARRLHAAISALAAAVPSSDTHNFFEHLLRNLIDLAAADGGFVAKLAAGERPVARTVSAITDGQMIRNFEYAVPDSPCERLLGEEEWLVVDCAEWSHAGSPLYSVFGARHYVGGRINDAAGQPIGMLFVLFRMPPQQLDFVKSAMPVFAARAAAELERRDADARIQAQASLLDQAQDAIIVCDLDNRVTFWNKSAELLYGWTAGEALGMSINDLMVDDSSVLSDARTCVLECADWRGEIGQRRRDGTRLTVEAHWTLVSDDETGSRSILAIHTDITQRKKAEEKIHHLAFYDQLTGLPNRMFLYDRLLHALASSHRSGLRGAIMFIDLDNFKTLNDTLGHDMGDLLLQQASLRISSCIRETDTAARFGGDEFVVLLEELSGNPDEAALQAKNAGEKILNALNRPYRLESYEHLSTSSIGVTLFKGREENADDILKRADLAMYQAKAAGRNAVRFFDPMMQETVNQRLTLEADLRNGSRANEFRLFYQAQVDGDGKIVGVEALVRWQQPKRGIVSPHEFIPVAEETGVILSLGNWILETACRQLAAWAQQRNMAQVGIAVNVSARQFHHPGFVEQVLAVIDKTGADPRKLKLELTESVLIEDIETTVAKMAALRSQGIGFALDDFGTGYSSLSYLKRLPLDELKIDQSFVRDVLTDPNDAAIARTIVALGQSLGLNVVAEGVETVEQRDFLAGHGCHTYQGYLFSRPVPADQFC